MRYFIGDKLETIDGCMVTVMHVNRETEGYETFTCDDGISRYDREGECENGRVTGTSMYPPHPKSIKAGYPLKNPYEVMLAMEGLDSGDTYSSNGKIDTRNAKKRIAHELDRLYELEKLIYKR